MNFSEALNALNKEYFLARKGWRSGTFIGRYFPSPSDFMTEPFLYIDTTNVIPSTPSTPSTVRGKAPWVPSQCDMNAQDWYIIDHSEVANNHVDATLTLYRNKVLNIGERDRVRTILN